MCVCVCVCVCARACVSIESIDRIDGSNRSRSCRSRSYRSRSCRSRSYRSRSFFHCHVFFWGILIPYPSRCSVLPRSTAHAWPYLYRNVDSFSQRAFCRVSFDIICTRLDISFGSYRLSPSTFIFRTYISFLMCRTPPSIAFDFACGLFLVTFLSPRIIARSSLYFLLPLVRRPLNNTLSFVVIKFFDFVFVYGSITYVPRSEEYV